MRAVNHREVIHQCEVKPTGCGLVRWTGVRARVERVRVRVRARARARARVGWGQRVRVRLELEQRSG